MPTPTKSQIRSGIRVQIVEKHNQRSAVTTTGVVKRLLTKSETHPHGIKVELETGEVGRVKAILDVGPD